jgi:hypothetical protein
VTTKKLVAASVRKMMDPQHLRSLTKLVFYVREKILFCIFGLNLVLFNLHQLGEGKYGQR